MDVSVFFSLEDHFNWLGVSSLPSRQSCPQNMFCGTPAKEVDTKLQIVNDNLGQLLWSSRWSTLSTTWSPAEGEFCDSTWACGQHRIILVSPPPMSKIAVKWNLENRKTERGFEPLTLSMPRMSMRYDALDCLTTTAWFNIQHFLTNWKWLNSNFSFVC